MRILAVLERLAPAGTEWQATHVLGELSRRGHRVELVTLEGSPRGSDVSGLSTALAEAGVEVSRLPTFHRWSLAEAGWKLGRRAAEMDADIIHGRLYFAGLAVAASKFACPTARRVVSFHNVIYDYPELRLLDHARKHVERAMLSATVDGFAAVSRGAAESYRRHHRLPKMPVIPNAVPDPQPSLRSRAELSERHGLREDLPWIVVPARFVFEKSHDDLLTAAARLRGEGVAFQMFFPGRGPLLEAVISRIQAEGLEDEVVVPEESLPRVELQEVFRQSAIVALPSKFEGFPNAAAEAMRVGAPVLGTEIPGFADLVVHGETGWLVPPSQPGRLAEGLAHLLRAEGLRRDLGAAGQRFASDQLSLSTVVDRWETLYRAVLGDEDAKEGLGCS